MPCTLQDWEIEYEEKRMAEEKDRKEKEKYGINSEDPRVIEEVACQLARFIYAHRLEEDIPELAKLWLKAHKTKDTKKGKKAWRRANAKRSYCLLTKRSIG